MSACRRYRSGLRRGLVYPVWAMVAMALSVTLIFINALWGCPPLFFDAVRSVGRAPETDERRTALAA